MGTNQTKLTPEDFNQILKGTKFTKEEIYQWFERFQSQFPKGKITPDGFAVMYKNLFPDGDASEFTNHIFRTYDANKDGVIDFSEFMMIINISQRGTTEEKLKWSFRLYDLDGNGQLTKDELEIVLKSIYKAKNKSKPEVKAKETTKKYLSKIDKDGDGQISEEEFVSAVSKSRSLKKILKAF